MDFGSANRAATVGALTLAARPDGATPGAVPVDLPAERTVQSAAAGEALKLDIRQRGRDQDRERDARALSSAATDADASTRRRADADGRERDLRDVIERRLLIDPATRSVVMQQRDRDTGETILTVPDEATLKLRQYGRALAARARLDADIARYVERVA